MPAKTAAFAPVCVAALISFATLSVASAAPAAHPAPQAVDRASQPQVVHEKSLEEWDRLVTAATGSLPVLRVGTPPEPPSWYTSKELWLGVLGAFLGGLAGFAVAFAAHRWQERSAHTKEIKAAYNEYLAAENRCAIEASLLLRFPHPALPADPVWQAAQRNYLDAMMALDAAHTRVLQADRDPDRRARLRALQRSVEWVTVFHRAPLNPATFPPTYTAESALHEIFAAHEVAQYEMHVAALGADAAADCIDQPKARTNPTGGSVHTDAAICNMNLRMFTS